MVSIPASFHFFLWKNVHIKSQKRNRLGTPEITAQETCYKCNYYRANKKIVFVVEDFGVLRT